jgi:hypothetical protein
MIPGPDLDPTIAQFYHRTPEEDRLEQGPFLLEQARTRELIRLCPLARGRRVYSASD